MTISEVRYQLSVATFARMRVRHTRILANAATDKWRSTYETVLWWSGGCSPMSEKAVEQLGQIRNDYLRLFYRPGKRLIAGRRHQAQVVVL